MQIKTSMRDYFTCFRMTTIKKNPNNKSRQEDVEKRDPLYTVEENVICVASLENRMEISQKTKIELPYDPSVLLLCIYLEKTPLVWKELWTCISLFIAALTIA